MSMTVEQLNIVVPAITTIAGAAIGAGISYLVGRQQFNATVVSANRQIWINTLRDCVAEFEATASMLSISSAYNNERFVEKLEKLGVLYSKVLLLLNPLEEDHRKLGEVMDNIIRTIEVEREQTVKSDFRSLKEQSIVIAQKILKREWERVKRGS